MTPLSEAAAATPPPASTASPATTVRDVLETARRVAGSGPLLAARLEELGVGPPDTKRYSESAVSNWIRGRTMPPADVLVAAASIAGLSLDRRLLSRSDNHPSAPNDLSEAVTRLQGEVDALRADLIELYGRLGYAMPRHETTPSDDAATSAASASAG
jgi:transcriptional regulator with XRE-family HTH domain